MLGTAAYFMFIAPPIEFQHLIDHLFYGLSFLAFTVTFLLSTLMHTFNCHSEPVSKFFTKMDYFGITSGLISSFIAGIYFAYYDTPLYQHIYTSLCFVLGIITLCVAFQVRKK